MGDDQKDGNLWTADLTRKLIDYTINSVDVEEDFHFLRFEFLQRLNIVRLEYELAQIKSRLYRLDYNASAIELNELRTRLHEYSKLLYHETKTRILTVWNCLYSYCNPRLSVPTRQETARPNRSPKPQVPASQALLFCCRHGHRPLGVALFLFSGRACPPSDCGPTAEKAHGVSA